MYYFGKDVEQSWSIVRLDFRRLLVLNNAYALLADIVVHRQLVKSAITDSIKMNQAKVHARFVMLDSILTTTAISTEMVLPSQTINEGMRSRLSARIIVI